MKNVQVILVVLAVSFFLSFGGCALFNPPVDSTTSPEQQKLDKARAVFDVSKRVVAVLIKTGYLAKNDKSLQDEIFGLALKGDMLFDKAQEIINSGNKLDFNFWFDQAMALVDQFTGYESQGMQKYNLSKPTTRPTLPHKVSYGRNRAFDFKCFPANDKGCYC